MTKEKKVTGFKMFKTDENGLMYCDPSSQRFYFEVGKEYIHDGKIEKCSSGFHFCEKLENCFKYYDCVSWNKIAIVEGYGERIQDDDKTVCSKIKIIKLIEF